MKKSVIMMCVGALLALCAPVSASESPATPPVKNEITWKKINRSTEKSETVASTQDNTVNDTKVENANPEPAPHSGGVVVISGAALLLIIVLLIILL
jgi:hypothetical protein